MAMMARGRGAAGAACALLLLAWLSPLRAHAAQADSATAADSTAHDAVSLVHPSIGRTGGRASPGVAAILSHAGIVLPIIVSSRIRNENSDDRRDRQAALVGLGIVVGPAIGYWYGGVPARGTRGAAGRMVCALVAGSSYYYLDSANEPDLGTVGFVVLGLAATGTAGVWALWDAATVAPRVEARNRQVRAVSWGVVPAVTPSGSPGVAVAARF